MIVAVYDASTTYGAALESGNFIFNLTFVPNDYWFPEDLSYRIPWLPKLAPSATPLAARVHLGWTERSRSGLLFLIESESFTLVQPDFKRYTVLNNTIPVQRIASPPFGQLFLIKVPPRWNAVFNVSVVSPNNNQGNVQVMLSDRDLMVEDFQSEGLASWEDGPVVLNITNSYINDTVPIFAKVFSTDVSVSFLIVANLSAPLSVTIDSKAWAVGSLGTISWALDTTAAVMDDNQPVSVYLHYEQFNDDDSSNFIKLGTVPSTSFSFPYNVPATAQPGQYRVRVCAKTHTSDNTFSVLSCAFSDPFAITSPFSVILPNAQTVYVLSVLQNYTALWSSYGNPTNYYVMDLLNQKLNLSLRLLDPFAQQYPPDFGLSNATFNLPLSLPAAQNYTLSLYVLGTSMQAISQPFAIGSIENIEQLLSMGMWFDFTVNKGEYRFFRIRLPESGALSGRPLVISFTSSSRRSVERLLVAPGETYPTTDNSMGQGTVFSAARGSWSLLVPTDTTTYSVSILDETPTAASIGYPLALRLSYTMTLPMSVVAVEGQIHLKKYTMADLQRDWHNSTDAFLAQFSYELAYSLALPPTLFYAHAVAPQSNDSNSDLTVKFYILPFEALPVDVAMELNKYYDGNAIMDMLNAAVANFTVAYHSFSTVHATTHSPFIVPFLQLLPTKAVAAPRKLPSESSRGMSKVSHASFMPDNIAVSDYWLLPFVDPVSITPVGTQTFSPCPADATAGTPEMYWFPCGPHPSFVRKPQATPSEGSSGSMSVGVIAAIVVVVVFVVVLGLYCFCCRSRSQREPTRPFFDSAGHGMSVSGNEVSLYTGENVQPAGMYVHNKRSFASEERQATMSMGDLDGEGDAPYQFNAAALDPQPARKPNRPPPSVDLLNVDELP